MLVRFRTTEIQGVDARIPDDNGVCLDQDGHVMGSGRGLPFHFGSEEESPANEFTIVPEGEERVGESCGDRESTFMFR